MVTFSQAEVNAYLARNLPRCDGHSDQDELDDESELHEQITKLLRSEGVHGIIHSRMDKPTTQDRGVPDFIFALDGIPIALEAKAKGKKPTVEQQGYLIALRLDGWLTGVVRSLADVVAILDQAKQRSSV